MKRIASVILLLIFTAYMLSLRYKTDNRDQIMSYPGPRSGVAILLTGAAARIPQEAALLEELDNRGLLKNLVFISGISSGALNSVALNAILSGKMSWTEYKEILFKIKNGDIYKQDGKKIPVNTEPARELFRILVEEKFGYHTIGDLPIATGISITNVKDLDLKRTVYRMCSRKINQETDTTLSLVDILMATTAFPIVFPPIRIPNVTTIPDWEYVDGAIGNDHVPYQALLDFQKFRGAGVEKVYIITRKTDSIPEFSDELKILQINDKGLLNRLGISIDAYLHKGIVRGIASFVMAEPELRQNTFVWMPDFDANFLLFNFENLREQYAVTSQWAKTHNPVPVDEFLLKQLKKSP